MIDICMYIGCIEHITLKATTGTESADNSNSHHRLVFEVKGAVNISVAIPCDSSKCTHGVTTNFEYNIEDYYSGESVPCVKPEDITRAALVEDGGDGWFIVSVYTNFITCGSAGPLTADEDFNLWIDGDDLPIYLEQALTLVQ